MSPGAKAGSVAQLAKLHQRSNPTHPSTIIPEMDPVVERVILRCLEKDPALRPASALATAAGLPGGDPLAAALAMGETPSPEMVAAAGDAGALSAPLACAGLGYILVGFLTIALLSGKTSILNWISQTKSPETLAERCSELIKSLGYNRETKDSVFGYLETDYPGRLGKEVNRSDLLRLGEPPAMIFWYRQSPGYLINPDFFYDGTVRQDDPPQIEPHMIRLQLDTNGRLVKLDAVPSKTDGAAHGKADPDWNAVLMAAGFDPAKLKPVAPGIIPPVYADSRMAWEGTYSRRSDISFHIEAAATKG